MIRPLRRVHLFVWAVLAILLPALLIGAIAVRRIEPDRIVTQGGSR